MIDERINQNKVSAKIPHSSLLPISTRRQAKAIRSSSLFPVVPPLLYLGGRKRLERQGASCVVVDQSRLVYPMLSGILNNVMQVVSKSTKNCAWFPGRWSTPLWLLNPVLTTSTSDFAIVYWWWRIWVYFDKKVLIWWGIHKYNYNNRLEYNDE
jgi:hypothetical protein